LAKKGTGIWGETKFGGVIMTGGKKVLARDEVSQGDGLPFNVGEKLKAGAHTGKKKVGGAKLGKSLHFETCSTR